MNDPGGPYTDPFEDALSHGAQRAAQLTSLIMAAAQVMAQQRARRAARSATGGEPAAAALADQERTAYRQAQLGWAAAHDPRWLAHADVIATAQAWGAAACYAGSDPVAAAALRKCEDRLRHLHPYAMARYDRLRADGMSTIDAMGEVVPLFARAPHARTGDPAIPRRGLPRGGHQAPAPGARARHVPEHLDPPGPGISQAEQRGREIAARLQGPARAAGRGDLGPAELATVLETVTSLPADVIERIAVPATGGIAASGRPASNTAAKLAAASFPYTAADALAAASSTAASARPGLSTGRSQSQRPRRSP